MDDDLEDELVNEIFWAHVKILSKVRLDLSMMADAAVFYLRLYMFRPGTVAVAVALIAGILLCHSTDIWFHLLARRLEVLSGYYGNRDKIRLLVNPTSRSDRASWELQGRHAGVYAVQGRRPRMEDRFSILSDADHDIHLYGIFDGHGGELAADFAEKKLFPSLIKRLVEVKSQHRTPKETPEQRAEGTRALLAEFSRVITEEILRLDTDLLAAAKAKKDLSGSTALVALVHGAHLVVANVGDSRGVLCDKKGQAVPLSFDHKPQQLKEHKRIKEAGGFITFNGVWRVAGVLATSRALGDFPLKDRRLVVAQPDVLTFNLADLGATFMVLASDGLWDALSNDDAVAFAAPHLDEPLCGARSLVNRAYDIGSLDNISALVVDLRGVVGDSGQGDGRTHVIGE